MSLRSSNWEKLSKASFGKLEVNVSFCNRRNGKMKRLFKGYISKQTYHVKREYKIDKDKIYGVAMGSPLSPVLANLFLGHHEDIWLTKYQFSSIHFYADKNSHIFKHLKSYNVYKDACSDSCFVVLDSANIHYKLKIQESLHNFWERP